MQPSTITPGAKLSKTMLSNAGVSWANVSFRANANVRVAWHQKSVSMRAQRRFYSSKKDKSPKLKRALSMVDGSDATGKKYADVPYHLRPALRVTPTGKNLLSTPTFNKGGAFSLGERDRLGLRGLLPPRRLTMKQQIERTEAQLAKEDSMIRKNLYLRDLLDTNETLFHRVLLDNIKELAPAVYTPTVGQACVEFGEMFRRPRDVFQLS